MKIERKTPKTAALLEIGQRLAKVRKARDYTQDQLATEAGVGVATLRRIEEGRDAQLGSWIKLLKALDMISSIDALLPEVYSSPMSEVKAGRKRRRAPRRSEGGVAWGDEQLLRDEQLLKDNQLSGDEQ